MALAKNEMAAQIMEHLVTHNSHGYSQYSREGDGGSEIITLSDGTKIAINTGDRDCSSAVVDAYRSAGVDVGCASYTGNMRSCMTGTGNFVWHPINSGYSPKRGDIYLNEGKHTAMCVTINPITLAEFSISEKGTIDGVEGDQTGWESHVRGYYSRPWDGILEYVGSGASSDPSSSPSYSDTGDISGGTYTCIVDELNVRDAPNISGGVVASYGRGDTVVLDSWSTVSDGYIWGRYIGYSGKTRYIAVRTVEGKDYLSKESSSNGITNSATSVSTSVPGGTYTCVVDKLNVRDAPNISGGVVASYGRGDTVVLDSWSTVSDGYIWGRYIGYSGKTRYIAVRTVEGKDYLSN